ncbi:Uncharacterized protein FWK35_00017411, partial [Aphis craccivora]
MQKISIQLSQRCPARIYPLRYLLKQWIYHNSDFLIRLTGTRTTNILYSHFRKISQWEIIPLTLRVFKSFSLKSPTKYYILVTNKLVSKLSATPNTEEVSRNKYNYIISNIIQYFLINYLPLFDRLYFKLVLASEYSDVRLFLVQYNMKVRFQVVIRIHFMAVCSLLGNLKNMSIKQEISNFLTKSPTKNLDSLTETPTVRKVFVKFNTPLPSSAAVER